MRNQLGTLAIAALLGAPCVAGAETTMSPDDQVRAGMMESNSQGTTESLEKGHTIKAEIVEIDGQRVITETEDGKQLVFHVEGSSVAFNVGDELELMVDNQAKTGVILNVFPKDQERKS